MTRKQSSGKVCISERETSQQNIKTLSRPLRVWLAPCRSGFTPGRDGFPILMRTKAAHLQKLVDAISAKQGRPSAELSGDTSTGVRSNPGAMFLNYNASYGGWDLCEYTNEKVCDSSLIGNTFAGRGRLSTREMETFLLGMLAAINGSEYFKPDFTKYGGKFATQLWVEKEVA